MFTENFRKSWRWFSTFSIWLSIRQLYERRHTNSFNNTSGLSRVSKEFSRPWFQQGLDIQTLQLFSTVGYRKIEELQLPSIPAHIGGQVSRLGNSWNVL